MTKQFLRNVEVRILGETDTLVLNRDLDVSFEVRKDRSTVPNEAIVSIRNLSEPTRQFIQANKSIELYTGYDTENVLLAKCDVTRRVTQWEPPDSITTIESYDGIYTITNKRVVLSLANGATIKQAIQSIAKQLGLKLILNADIELKTPLKGGYTHTGTAVQALDDLTSSVNASWGIINNTLVFTIRGKALNNTKTLTISPENGLLAQPEVLDDTIISERVLPKRIQPKGYNITMLLRPQLNPFDLIEVQSRFVNGLYVVDTVEHIGGNRTAEFITRATIYERL
jgi:hypothetical protein